MLHCLAGVFLEPLEVLVEHIRHFIQIGFVLFLVGPAVDRVQYFTIHSFQNLGVGQIEDWEVTILDLGEAAVVDSVDYGSSIADADALNSENSTLPTPYLPPVHPVLTSQTFTLWSLIFL